MDPIDVTKCPDCDLDGHYDARVKIGGRGIYTCPNGHKWQDADEVPDEKGYTPLRPPYPEGPPPGPPNPPRPPHDRPYA